MVAERVGERSGSGNFFEKKLSGYLRKRKTFLPLHPRFGNGANDREKTDPAKAGFG
jgi:hypothetical protein